MQALVFDGRQAAVQERPDPEASAGTSVVRVHLAGVCNTDIEIARGYMGFRGVLGHEFVGTVESGPDALRGRRVVGEINFACGQCDACRGGLERHCPARTVMGIQGADGAFAERVAVPVANLHAVPDGVADETAVFVEPLAAAFEILEQVHLLPGMRCTVLGDGKLGLLVAQVLRHAGTRVRAVGRHAEKLEMLARHDIETVLAGDFEPESERADLVVEATGTSRGLEAALAATRPRGTVILKSTVAERSGIDLAPLVIHEIQLLGSRCGPFAPALRALESREIEVAPLLSDRVPLARADEALRLARQPGAMKVLVDCR
jgi:threonine dehydrogenase-like Zn-dependent dehydrogenase